MARVEPSPMIDGVVLVVPAVHADDRGMFVETYRRQWFPGGREMVQANRADRSAGCVVGLHYHLHQADYWYVVSGHARVVLHDLRAGGATDGATLCLDLGEVGGEPNNHLGLYIPPGVAHGFASVSDLTLTYLVDGHFNPADELGVAWDDPDIDADWAVTGPVLSDRDRANVRRADLEACWRPHVALRT